MSNGWLFADVLHGVDLAASWPAGGADVVAEHPEGRPHALSLGDFYARFETAIFLLKQTRGFQSRGSVLPGNALRARVVILDVGDYQVAVLHVCILRAIRIALEFVVTPTVAAGFHSPLGRIRHGAVDDAEFVAPHQRVGGWRWWRRL